MPNRVQANVRRMRRARKARRRRHASARCGRPAQVLAAVDPDRMADFCRLGHAQHRPAAAGKQASAAPISPPPSRKNPPPRSKRSCAASGTISAAWAPNSPISTGCGISTRPSRAHGRIDIAPERHRALHAAANDGKPALIFAAHLANWELPAICAATYKLDSAVLYRRPNIAAHRRLAHQTRAASMGELIPTGLDAPMKLADALERGAHVGMLVDQYYVRGVEVTFFGRRTMANPLLARLARHFDCPIHGTRVIRLPGHRFRVELTEEIEPARDAEGKIDIAGTMQIITSVVEGWIREIPSSGCGCTGAGGRRTRSDASG